MSQMSWLIRAVPLAVLLLATLPSPLHADWFVTPYAGITFNTRAVFADSAGEFENTFAVTPTFGASLTRTTQGWFDLEADVVVAPGFFGNRIPDDGFQYGDSLLISAMGNVLVRPLKAGTWVGLSPYAAAGAGLFHTRIADPNDAFEASGNQLAFDAGGGVTAAIGGRLRLQVDARYFRTLQSRQPKDELDLAIDSLSFWRTVVGIGFRF
jgi:hypothetical protein